MQRHIDSVSFSILKLVNYKSAFTPPRRNYKALNNDLLIKAAAMRIETKTDNRDLKTATLKFVEASTS
jgi:hypothetical protein